MVEFRLLRFRVSRMTEEECVRAHGSCKELEARIVKRLNSFRGEFLEGQPSSGTKSKAIPASDSGSKVVKS